MPRSGAALNNRALFAAVIILTARCAFASGQWFEEAPPTLPFYLHRLPAKSLEEIFNETATPIQGQGWVDLKKEIPKLAQDVLGETPASLIPKIDQWLFQLRRDANAYSGLFNLLHDVRDALSAPDAEAQELSDYIKWRFDHAAWLGVDWRDNGIPRSTFDEPKLPENATAEIEKRLASASPALKANWIYLRGAVGFKAGEDTRSQQWFERVIAEFPQHPRAEAALFMDARCQLSRSRTPSRDDPPEKKNEAAKNRPRAKELFQQYLQKYPRGAYAADALGWLGAIEFDEQNYAAALPFYIHQTEIADHPELRRSALEMCQKALTHIASAPEDAGIAEVAARPRLAMGLMYLIVNTTEANNFDGKYDDVETVRKWRRAILPRLGKAVAADEKFYRDVAWQPRYLAILAQAASGAGQTEEALRLTSNQTLLEKNDDLAFARAVALSRAHRADEAVAALKFFRQRFPQSKLAHGAQLRLALALQDAHHAGEAVLELQKLDHPTSASSNDRGGRPEGAPLGDQSDAEPEQVAELIDTLLNFAPLPELASALQIPDLSNEQRLSLTDPLAQRYLARENFAEAKKFMTPAQWSLAAEQIEQQAVTASHASPAEKPVHLVKLGDEWEKVRGKLLRQPLDSVEMRAAAFKDQAHLAGKFRTENARALGFDVDAELQNRDELEHARTWWTRAANATPRTPLAANCLWKALEAIPRIASASVFNEERMAASGGAKNSREIYERLRRECPDSHEAQRLAAYWSFPKQSSSERESFVQEQFEPGADSEASQNGYPCGDFGAFNKREERWQEESNSQKTWPSIIESLPLLDDETKREDAATVRDHVGRLLARAREAYQDVDYAIYLNLLEDLSLFFHEPNLTGEAARVYVPLRIQWLRFAYSGAGGEYRESRTPPDDLATAEARWREEVAAAQKNPAVRALIDYIDFLPLALIAHKRIYQPVDDFDKDGEPFTYPSRDYRQLEKLAREFLAHYPKSKKREAATLLLAKAVSAQSRPYILHYGVGRTGQNVRNWMETIEPRVRSFQQEPFKAERVRASLEAYEREFPNGKYAAEIRSLRAAFAWRTHDWPAALDLTVAQLDDAAHLDLRPEAAARLASIFAQLADAKNRADIIDALRSRRRAILRLRAFLAKAGLYRSHPLRYLGDYLGDRLGFKVEYEMPQTN